MLALGLKWHPFWMLTWHEAKIMYGVVDYSMYLTFIERDHLTRLQGTAEQKMRQVEHIGDKVRQEDHI